MPESPDFDQIARAVVEEWGTDGPADLTPVAVTQLADRLRQIWNARGAADLARLEVSWGVSLKEMARTIQSLDR